MLNICRAEELERLKTDDKRLTTAFYA